MGNRISLNQWLKKNSFEAIDFVAFPLLALSVMGVLESHVEHPEVAHSLFLQELGPWVHLCLAISLLIKSKPVLTRISAILIFFSYAAALYFEAGFFTPNLIYCPSRVVSGFLIAFGFLILSKRNAPLSAFFATLGLSFLIYGMVPVDRPWGKLSGWMLPGDSLVYPRVLFLTGASLIALAWKKSGPHAGKIPSWFPAYSWLFLVLPALAWWRLGEDFFRVLASQSTLPLSATLQPRLNLLLRVISSSAISGFLFLLRRSFIQSESLSQLNHALGEQMSKNKRILVQLKKARKKAISASHAKSDFLANMSHEIRSPLNVILGLIRLSGEKRKSTFSQTQLDTMGLAGEQLLALVNNILDISKIENRKMPLSSESFSAKELFQNVYKMYLPLAREKKLRFILKIDPQLPKQLVGDPIRIKQIAINLVSNAFKFTSRGSIQLLVHWHSKSESLGSLEIKVIDTGCGMNLETQNRLFQPYAQGNERKHIAGTGLGLSISRQLTELMQGTLGVTSKENQGSNFWVELPLSIGIAIASVPTHKKKQPIQAHLHVLVVDDDPFNREIAYETVTGFGWTAETVASGQEALERLKHPSPRIDLILMDCRMPELNGFQTTHLLREQGIKMPVIGLTASALAEDVTKGRKEGMNIVLMKPYTSEQLKQAVESCLQVKLKETKLIEKISSEDLLEVFHENMERGLAELETLMHQKSYKEVSQVAHRLKSSCGFLKFEALYEVLEELEFASNDRKRTELLQEAIECYEGIKSANLENFSPDSRSAS